MFILLFFFMLVAKAGAEPWVCESSKQRVYTNTPTVSDEQSCKPFRGGNLNWVSPEAMAAMSERETLKLSKGEIRSSLTFKEVNTKNKRRSARGINRGCHLKGKINSQYVGKAEIKVLRGALTTDRFRVSLPGGRFDWEQVVEGHCRNPRVTVSIR